MIRSRINWLWKVDQAATGIMVVLAFLFLGTHSSALAQQSVTTANARQAVVSGPRVVTVNNLPHRAGQTRAGWTAPRPHNGLTDAQWKQLKARASKLPDPNGYGATGKAFPGPGHAPDTPGPFAEGGPFPGQDEDLSCSGGVPSDMALAVGQNHVVQVVNDCMSIYEKLTGTLLQGPISLNDLFSSHSIPPNNNSQFITDPVAMYDFVARRFVVTAIWEDFPHSKGIILLAASQSDDPTGPWNTYVFGVGTTGQCPDFPTMGQASANDPFIGAIYIGINIFPCNSDGFIKTEALVSNTVLFAPKGPIYAGQK